MTYLGATVIGIIDGFEGLVEGRMRELARHEVSDIIGVGGTILGTSNKGDPFRYPLESHSGITTSDMSTAALANYNKWKLDALVVIGGDGTMNIAHRFVGMGMNVVGVPKTIDNDLESTDQTFGYDSALTVATEAIDRLHTTASSHHRAIIVEVMGRYAGWIALGAGVAGGADMILIPEIPFKWSSVFNAVQERQHGARFSIICVAEGAKPEGEDVVALEKDAKRTDPIRLGGIGELVAKRIQKETGVETRTVVLGHIQRGGSPTAFDRVLATKFGAMALESISLGQFDCMVSLKGRDVVTVRLQEAIKHLRLVPPECQLVMAARAVGTSFGD
jgi:6-phosphofructokinase 1